MEIQIYSFFKIKFVGDDDHDRNVDKSSFNSKPGNIRGGYKTQTGLQVVIGS